MEYRLSEGVVLRKVGPGRIEAWRPLAQQWAVYPDIYKDWIEASMPVSERGVPVDARQAPSSYAD
jgi:hypothetical protein